MAQSRWAPFVLFIGGVLTRSLGAYLGGVRGDDEDGIYFLMAKNFLEGNGFSYLHPGFGRLYSWLPPGMSFLYLPFLLIWGPSELPIFLLRIFFILESSAAVVLLYYLAKRLMSEGAAFFAAFLWVAYPAQWFWASRVNPHTHATNLVVLAVWVMFLAWEKRSAGLAILVGLLWGFASLTRGEWSLGVGVFILCHLWAIKRGRKVAGSLVGVVLGWILVMGPWVARNFRIHGQFVLVSSNSGDAFQKVFNPDYNFSGDDIPFSEELLNRLKKEPNEVRRSHILKREGMDFIRSHPGRAVRNVAGNFLNFWRPWLSFTARDVSLFRNIVYIVTYLPIFLLFVSGLYFQKWEPAVGPDQMMKRSLFDSLQLQSQPVGWAVAFEMAIKARLLNLQLGEVPIISIDRLYGGKSTFHLRSWMIEYFRWFIWGCRKLWAVPRAELKPIALRIPSAYRFEQVARNE